MPNKIAGLSGEVLEVDINKSAHVTLKDSAGNSLGKKHREDVGDENTQAIMVAGKNDDFATMMRVDRKGNQIMGNYLPELVEPFEGATVHVQKWTATSTTFAPTQTTVGGYSHNPGNSVAINAGTMLVSQRLFYKMARVPLQIKRRFRHSLVANSIHDFGFGNPSALTTLIVPNGASFRFATSGVVQALITYAGVEIGLVNVTAKSTLGGNTIGGNLNMQSLIASYYTYDIIVDDDNALFTIQDTETGQMVGFANVPVPAGIQKMRGSTGLSYYERTYNLGTSPASSPVVITTDIMVLSTDIGHRPDASQMAGHLGLAGSRNPFTGAQLENHTNSTAPVSATLANATAGYTTFGGKWQFVAVAGAITDYCLFGPQVPAGSRFLCEGIKIDAYNTGAVSTITPTVLEFAMGFNSSAVSLATANIIRKQIGVLSMPVGAVVGALIGSIDVNFNTPEVVESGRFLQVILTMPIGTATVSEIIRGTVTLKGRFI